MQELRRIIQMSWIKVSDYKPPTHEVILFRHKSGNEHYGVLCGDNPANGKPNQFWCQIFQKSFPLKDIIYWCEIPINKYALTHRIEFIHHVNLVLREKFSK